MEKSASGQVYRYPPASGLLLGAGLVAYLATVLLLISFASPYWLESYQEANAEFVRLGLWDVCFRNYRHPSYQYDETFNGCHWIHSYAYQNIRDWLLPSESRLPLAPDVASCSTLLGRRVQAQQVGKGTSAFLPSFQSYIPANSPEFSVKRTSFNPS